MSLVDFRYRRSKPDSPEPGYFYWIDNQDGNHQLWFAVTENQDEMLLLNEDLTERFEGLVSRVVDIESGIDSVNSALVEIRNLLEETKDEILNDIDSRGYLTNSDLDGYVKIEVLEDYIPKSELDELAKKSDLEGYVKTEDALDYLTSSDLDDYLKVSELPVNVSAFINDAGYATLDDIKEIELTDSDYDIIAEKVKEDIDIKPLKWERI